MGIRMLLNANRLAFALSVILLLSGISASQSTAAGSSSGTSIQLLNSAMSEINCKTNFTVSFINKAVAAAPGVSSLSQQAARLQQETSQLQAYASEGNVSAFRSYLKGTYDPQLREIKSSVFSELRDANLTLNATRLLRVGYKSAIDSFVTCSFNSKKQFALAKVSSFNSFISRYQQSVIDFGSKGLDTTQMSQILSDASSQIVTPLQSAIESAKSSGQISEALDQYCLFDGCGGMNFHLAAHFDLAKLQSIYDKVGGMTNLTSGQRAQQAIVQNDISATSSALAAVGTAKYTQTTRQNVWDSMNKTVNDIKVLFRTH
jgi:hypothetical protein